MMFRQTRSLGMRRIQFAAGRSVMEALTGGNVDEREVELRAELRQVVTNIYIELRRGSGQSWISVQECLVIGTPFECLRDPENLMSEWGSRR